MDDKPVVDIPPPVSTKERLMVPFSFELFIALFQQLGNKVQGLPILPFIDLLYEITKMFKALGKTLSLAFSDVTEKAELIDNHLRKRYSEMKTIQEICEAERKAGVIRLNGQNMKKEGIPKTHPYYKYSSVSRTIVRTSWLFHFIIHLSDLLAEFPDKSLSSCAKEAYNVSLGPHHPVLVRSAASLAFLACPNRKKFLDCFVGKDLEKEERDKRLEMIKGGMEEVWEKVMKEILENKYEKLP